MSYFHSIPFRDSEDKFRIYNPREALGQTSLKKRINISNTPSRNLSLDSLHSASSTNQASGATTDNFILIP